MKTYFSENKELFAVVLSEKTVYLINKSKSKIFKQFPLDHFDNENWEKVENFATFFNLKRTFDAINRIPKKELQKIRMEREKNKQIQTVSELLKNRLQKKLEKKLRILANGLPSMGYSMGAEYVVRFNKFKGDWNDKQEYSRSSKFRATHGYFELKIDRDTLENATVEGGLFTYIYPNQKWSVKKCWWYVATGEKQHYKLKKEYGYVYAGFHAYTRIDAKKGGENNTKIEKQRVKREKEAAKLREINAKKATKEQAKKEKLFKKALRMQYSYEDSISAGNCIAGTKAFILRLHLDSSKKYRGKFLLDAAEKKSRSSVSYVKKMIEKRALNLAL